MQLSELSTLGKPVLAESLYICKMFFTSQMTFVQLAQTCLLCLFTKSLDELGAQVNGKAINDIPHIYTECLNCKSQTNSLLVVVNCS